MHCSIVSPCVIHPGSAGTVTVYPPSSVSGSRTMVYFLIMHTLQGNAPLRFTTWWEHSRSPRKPVLNKRLVLFCHIFGSPPATFFFCITFIPVHAFVRVCRCISECAIVPG